MLLPTTDGLQPSRDGLKLERVLGRDLPQSSPRCAGFSGGLISGSSEFPQFLILGLDKSGKTTLLYRPGVITGVITGKCMR